MRQTDDVGALIWILGLLVLLSMLWPIAFP